MKSKFKSDALLQMQKMERVLKDLFFFKYHPPLPSITTSFLAKY